MNPEFEVDANRDEEDDPKKGRKLEKLQVTTSKGVMKEHCQQMIDDIDLTIEPERISNFYHYKR